MCVKGLCQHRSVGSLCAGFASVHSVDMYLYKQYCWWVLQRSYATLFSVFLERIMTDALEDHEGTVSIGSRAIINLCFADDIDGLAGDEEELAKLVEYFDKASTAYGMEISAEKTKLMTNNTSGINTEIKVNGEKLETVTSFKYLGSVITDESSKHEILSRIAQATAALTRLKPVWNDRRISLSSKI